MNQSDSSHISPLKEGQSGNSSRAQKGPTLSFGQYALGYGLPFSLAIFFLTLGLEAQPLDLLIRLLCVAFAALFGKYFLSAQLSAVTLPPKEDISSEAQILAVHRALASLQLPTLLQQFVDEMVMLIPCQGALFILLDDKQEEPEYVVTNGKIPASAAQELSTLLPQELFLEALAKKTVILNTPQELEDRLGALQGRTFATKNLFIGCLRRKQQLAFLLVAERVEEEGFLPKDEELFTMVAQAATVAIENARLHASLQEKEKSHRDFLRDLIQAQEQDRKHFAEEWQEQVGNKLFEILQGLRSFQSLIVQRTPEIGERFQELTAIVDESAALVRGLTNELHPAVLDDFGVAAAIREYVTEGAKNLDRDLFQVTVEADDAGQQLPNEAKLLLFRITQEALRNIRQHADAKNVQIAFTQEHSGVSLMIKDDGKGFDSALPHSGHFGLHYMKERAEAYGGTFHIVSSQGQGTEVHIKLPSAADT